MIQFFTDPQKKALLKVEIATTIDWGRPATYSLEEDGPLALHCYEKIETIKAGIHTAHTPNLDAVARQLSTSAEKAYCRRHFLLHIPEDQHLQARHYSKELFSMVLPVCNLAWIILKNNSI